MKFEYNLLGYGLEYASRTLMDPDDIGHCIVPIPPELEPSLVKGPRYETTTIRVAIPSTAGVRLLQLKAAYLGLAQYGLGEDDNCTACITSCVNGAILFFLGIANPRASALYSFHAWPSNIDDSDRNLSFAPDDDPLRKVYIRYPHTSQALGDPGARP